MRKTLLTLVAFVATMAASAGNKAWTASFEPVNDAKELKGVHTATAADGAVYVSSTYNQEFTFAGKNVTDPEGLTSSAIVKYSAEGKELWAVTMEGAAVVYALDTDADGTLYAAGNFNDVVTYTDATGATAEIASESVFSAFVAKINAEGKVEAMKVITPAADADIEGSFMYFPEGGDINVTPRKIQVEGDKVYVSAFFSGDVAELSWEGAYLNVFDFMYMDNKSAGVFSLNKSDLSDVKSVATVQNTELVSYSQYCPETLSFVADNSAVYVGFVGLGNLTLTTADGSQDFTFAMDGEGSNEHAFVLATIGETTTAKTFNTAAHSNLAATYNLFMEANGDNLIIGGTYYGELPFNTELTTGEFNSAIFTASVKKADGAVNWAYTGECETTATCMTITDAAFIASADTCTTSIDLTTGAAKTTEATQAILCADKEVIVYTNGTKVETTIAQEEIVEFKLTYMDPVDGAKKTSLNSIYMVFTKDITITIPEGGIDVVNTVTQEVVKITKFFEDEYATEHNSAVFYLDGQLSAGNWTCTIPAGVITSVDNEVFPETTFSFGIVSTFNYTSYSPMETNNLEKIEITFDTEITEVKIPNSGLFLTDLYWTKYFYLKNEVVISEDKKTVTLELEEPITEPGQYFMDLYQGVFVSADGVNVYGNLAFNVYDPTPGFNTNYAEGDKVKELSNVLEITFKNVENVELVDPKGITVYLPSESSIEGTAKLENGKVVVTFDAEFTEEGIYTFSIAAGAFKMDGAANEAREINVELFKFELLPLEVVSVTPVVGTVDSITQIVVKFNQYIKLYYDKDGVTPSQDIYLTCGEEEYKLTNVGGSFISDELIYSSAEWNGFEYESKSITTPGTYTLNLKDIIVFHGAEDIVETEWYSYADTWHAENASCEGTYSWTIKGDSSVESVPAAEGEQVIYDLLGRRVEAIVGGGIYIVNGKKVVIK